MNTWFWVDGANHAFVNLMKVAFNESLNWQSNKQSVNPGGYEGPSSQLCYRTGKKNKQMLTHLHMLINKEYLCIPKQHVKLIISLRSAYANEYSLDKEQTSYSDSLDALHLSCNNLRQDELITFMLIDSLIESQSCI